MSKYNIHSDFKKYESFKLPFYPALLPMINVFLAKTYDKVKPAEGVVETKRRIPGYQNGLIDLRIYEPEGIEDNAPCLIYLHGGAFVFKAAPYHKNLLCQYALRTPCKVIYVDYRLAPKYAFPVGLEDSYAAFEWICNNAEELGIDRNRIAVGGDSAGGALAAGISLLARDRKGPGICFQMLIYPTTDARQQTESIIDYTDTPVWNSELNKKMWKLYLRNGVNNLREYASPMEAASFGNLPASYVEVCDFDCLRDEGINYAEALSQSGIPVDLYKTSGTIHGFEVEGKSNIIHQSVAKRIAALKSAFVLPSPTVK